MHTDQIDPAIQFEANKMFTMRGVDYKPGDLVDISQLPEHKVGQFLNQRMIRPRRPAGMPVDQPPAA